MNVPLIEDPWNYITITSVAVNKLNQELQSWRKQNTSKKEEQWMWGAALLACVHDVKQGGQWYSVMSDKIVKNTSLQVMDEEAPSSGNITGKKAQDPGRREKGSIT